MDRKDAMDVVKKRLKREWPSYKFSVRGYKKDNKTIEIIVKRVNFRVFIKGATPPSHNLVFIASQGADHYYGMVHGYHKYSLLLSKEFLRFSNSLDNLLLNLNLSPMMFACFICGDLVRRECYDEEDLAGTISKPTEIDHKTFKGRKRRSVAEAIIGGC